MRHLFTLVLLLTTLSIYSQQSVSSSSPIIYIYDASGSMWGQMDKKTKMQIAGKVLTQALDKLPEKQAVGLVAYGHRRQKDCEDVEFLVSPDNTDKQKVRSAIADIKPLGRTPLAYSALQVIDYLRTNKQKATIILITDGIESCSGDLCEVIKQAKEEGIDFKLHIIGFGLKTDETAALKCAAKEGEGNYYDADDANDLAIVVDEATSIATDLPEGEIKTKPKYNLSVFALKNNEPLDIIAKVIHTDNQSEIARTRTYADTGYTFAPEGTYDIVCVALANTDVAPITLSDVKLSTNEITHRTVSFDAGSLTVNVTSNGEPTDAKVSVIDPTTKKAITYGRTYKKSWSAVVNPGTYDVEIRDILIRGEGTKYTERQVVIKQGETTTVEHNFGSGEISVFVSSNGEPWDATFKINAVINNDNVTSGRTYSRTATKEVSADTYNVTVKFLNVKGVEPSHTFENIVLKAGEKVSLEHDFPSGNLSIGAQYQGELVDAVVSIYESKTNTYCGGGRTYTTSKSNPKSTLLLPGTYTVKLKALGEHKGKAKEISVTVKAGETTTHIVKF